jgi:hypothetical protein
MNESLPRDVNLIDVQPVGSSAPETVFSTPGGTDFSDFSPSMAHGSADPASSCVAVPGVNPVIMYPKPSTMQIYNRYLADYVLNTKVVSDPAPIGTRYNMAQLAKYGKHEQN